MEQELREYIETKEITPQNIVGRFDLTRFMLDNNPNDTLEQVTEAMRNNRQLTDEIFQTFELYFYTQGYVNIIKAMELEECDSLLCSQCKHLEAMVEKSAGLKSSIINKCQELANRIHS